MNKKNSLKPKNVNNSGGYPLAVTSFGDEVFILNKKTKKNINDLYYSTSLNGIDFINQKKKIVIKTIKGKNEELKDCNNFIITKTPNAFILSYFKKGNSRKKDRIVIAKSKDLYRWDIKAEILAKDSKRSAVIYLNNKDKYEMYKDGLFIKGQSSYSLSVWKEKPSLLFTSRYGSFDQEKINIFGATSTLDGPTLLYDSSVNKNNKKLLQVGGVIFDKFDPKRIIWRAGMPIWQGIVELKDNLEIEPFGFVSIKDKFIIYWITNKNGLIAVVMPSLLREDVKIYPKILDRYHKNPIIEPVVHNHWENDGTFNPAVVEDDEGVIHLLYRAVGGDGISRIGYAKSKDGFDFSNRNKHPVFIPQRGEGMPDKRKASGPTSYNPFIYTSGGGWGGAEDPRAVIIDGRVYMVYTAFEGWSSMRIALTSISLEDFKSGNWVWRKPKLISSPHNRSKNWLIFPEKINGKFAIIHSIYPEVLIDYVDDLDNFEGYIHSPRPEGPQPGRKKSWDFLLKGAGPPPIKTEAGWLLLYHALTKEDTGKYRLGAMILDINDPTKILYRSKHPILSPDFHYENEGKPGVVYASGLVLRGDDLYIYYGGGDRVVCVATTSLKKLLKYLKSGSVKDYQLNIA